MATVYTNIFLYLYLHMIVVPFFGLYLFFYAYHVFFPINIILMNIYIYLCYAIFLCLYLLLISWLPYMIKSFSFWPSFLRYISRIHAHISFFPFFKIYVSLCKRTYATQ